MGICYRDPARHFLCSFLFISFRLDLFCNAANTISQGQLIRDGETLVSSGQSFELGFFSPENSTLRYVGIWYNSISIKSIVWVGNRDNPVSDENGVFKIGEDGNLDVFDGSNTSVWSSNASVASSNTTAMLMDTGNLVLSGSVSIGDTSKAYWQSFNYPSDTYLPGMKVLVNQAFGENRAFTSWKSASDPATGNYSMGVDPRGAPQIVVWEGSGRRWRSGHWNGLVFTGVQNMTANYLYGFQLSSDDGSGNRYFTYTPLNSSHILRFVIEWDGFEEQLKWSEGENNWTLTQLQPGDECQFYNKCGNFSSCNVDKSPICACIHGFEARDSDQWRKGNWSGGCIRSTQLQCEGNSSVSEGEVDGFLEVQGVNLPDFVDSVYVIDMEECKQTCLNNCSCKAYAYVSGINCMIWSGDLVDIRYSSENGQTLYVRLDKSELGGSSSISKIAIIAIALSGTVFLGISIWLLWRFRTNLKACSNPWQKHTDSLLADVNRSKEFSTDISGPDDLAGEGKPGNGPDLPMFSFQYVAAATDYFSLANKLGQGGFGPVYKGNLPGGQEIAVKRLSKISGQGLEEFKNEIILIAKLQHRNLVRLLGCCIQGEEKMLIYEYMPNKSLDCFLFDPAKQAQLDWQKRFAIIEGIARGLLYLHRDSRLRIIHRDLKASNILLDEEMNPKISDFGMARIFGGNQNEANTNRVVGTYGYMALEYAMEGLFSVKSDVYSFGVLLLEILSGRRNNSFRMSENSSLIGHAWNLWNEGKAMELIDRSVANSCCRNEVLRCVHVGMLCVQDSAAYRPNMSSVLLMLESESAPLPLPRQPTVTSKRSSVDLDIWNEGQVSEPSTDITISVVAGR